MIITELYGNTNKELSIEEVGRIISNQTPYVIEIQSVDGNKWYFHKGKLVK